MSASIQNPAAAQTAQAELLKQTRPTIAPREAADTREHVETTGSDDDVDYGVLEVDGETIALERPLGDELGVGHLARLEAAADGRPPDRTDESIVAFLDAINTCTPPDYPTSFWFDLSQTALGDAFAQARQQSRGGERAGE